MWHEIFLRCLLWLIVCAAMWGGAFIAARKHACSGPFWIMLLGIGWSDGITTPLFKYHPNLSVGFMSYALCIGIPVAICIPALLLMFPLIKWNQKQR